MNAYWALVHHQDGAFGISFPDVPGCVSAADSLDRALAEGRDALSAHLAWLRADGDPVPAPRTRDELVRDAQVVGDAKGATWHQVEPATAEPPRIRAEVSIEAGLLRRVDQVAEAEGKTRSALLEEALRTRLARTPEPRKAAVAG